MEQSKPTITYKRCTTCKKDKPLEAFQKRSHKMYGQTHYKSCKSCRSYVSYKASSPEEQLKRRLKIDYSLSIEDYQKMLSDQQGLCAICHQPETVKNSRNGSICRLSVDHCHRTGAVRGLLCQACNRALGQLREDPNIAKSLLKYIEEKVLY